MECYKLISILVEYIMYVIFFLLTQASYQNYYYRLFIAREMLQYIHIKNHLSSIYVERF